MEKDYIYNVLLERGYNSIFQLQMERQMTYPAALLTMEWLINEPKIALKSLKRKIR